MSYSGGRGESWKAGKELEARYVAEAAATLIVTWVRMEFRLFMH